MFYSLTPQTGTEENFLFSDTKFVCSALLRVLIINYDWAQNQDNGGLPV